MIGGPSYRGDTNIGPTVPDSPTYRFGPLAPGAVGDGNGGGKDDDRNEPTRPSAVSLEAGIGPAERVRQRFLFRGVGHSCEDGSLRAGQLDLRERLALQVEPPVGRTATPAVGGNDCDSITMTDTCERGRMGSTGSASGRGDEGHVAAVPVPTEASSGESMHRNVRPRQRLGGELDAALVVELVHVGDRGVSSG